MALALVVTACADGGKSGDGSEPEGTNPGECSDGADNETEAAIQRSLQTLCRDRTTIVIAHRLSTVRNAHRIHVLGNGTLLESGTHDDLIANDGHYARLWNVQTGLSNEGG